MPDSAAYPRQPSVLTAVPTATLAFTNQIDADGVIVG